MSLQFEWDDRKAKTNLHKHDISFAEAEGNSMSNATNDRAQTADDDMRSEYDFSQGVRGKHAAAMRSGYTITIQRADGTTLTRDVKPTEGAVVLEPDVLRYFPDSESVNRALRTLIALFPKESVRSSRRTAHR